MDKPKDNKNLIINSLLTTLMILEDYNNNKMAIESIDYENLLELVGTVAGEFLSKEEVNIEEVEFEAKICEYEEIRRIILKNIKKTCYNNYIPLEAFDDMLTVINYIDMIFDNIGFKGFILGVGNEEIYAKDKNELIENIKSKYQEDDDLDVIIRFAQGEEVISNKDMILTYVTEEDEALLLNSNAISIPVKLEVELFNEDMSEEDKDIAMDITNFVLSEIEDLEETFKGYTFNSIYINKLYSMEVYDLKEQLLGVFYYDFGTGDYKKNFNNNPQIDYLFGEILHYIKIWDLEK